MNIWIFEYLQRIKAMNMWANQYLRSGTLQPEEAVISELSLGRQFLQLAGWHHPLKQGGSQLPRWPPPPHAHSIVSVMSAAPLLHLVNPSSIKPLCFEDMQSSLTSHRSFLYPMSSVTRRHSNRWYTDNDTDRNSDPGLMLPEEIVFFYETKVSAMSY